MARRLREAIGPNGQLIIDLVPELKLIVGEQPLVPELPSHAAQRRFQVVFRRFLAVRPAGASSGPVPRRFAMARFGNAGPAGGFINPAGPATSDVDRGLPG